MLPGYGAIIRFLFLPNAKILSFLVAFGETIIGIALILGFFTITAALLGAFLNLNFMFAGSAGINPYMYTAAIFLAAAGENATLFSVDQLVNPFKRRTRLT